MLKLNPAATVDAVADLNQVLDAKRDATLSLLRKNKARLYEAADRLREHRHDKGAHREYLAVAARCGISPKTLDTFFGLPHVVTHYRSRFSLSARVGTKYPVSGPRGLLMLADALEQPVRERPAQAPTSPQALPPEPVSPGLVIRIDGYPNLYITTRTPDIAVLINALKDL